MTQEYLSKSTREQLETQLKYADGYIESLKTENDELKIENKALKQQIKYMENACDGSCFSNEEDDQERLIAKLQDQHQQDCIKINQLHVTIDTLVDKYSRLRKNVGID